MLLRFSLYGFLKNQRYFEPFLVLVLLVGALLSGVALVRRIRTTLPGLKPVRPLDRIHGHGKADPLRILADGGVDGDDAPAGVYSGRPGVSGRRNVLTNIFQVGSPWILGDNGDR